jgi:uncharacterized membrane protein
MLSFLVMWLTTALVFAGGDALWLGWIAKSFYRHHLGPWMAPQPVWSAAILFYILLITGISIFVTAPALREDSLRYALIYGALFGFFTYMTYDLTNLATIRNWPLALVPVDIAWGSFLTAMAATAGFLATRWLTPLS